MAVQVGPDNNWYGHGSYDAWYAAHLLTLAPTTRAVRPGTVPKTIVSVPSTAASKAAGVAYQGSGDMSRIPQQPMTMPTTSGCSSGCSGSDSSAQIALLQKQLDAQLANLQQGELAFQTYLDQVEADKQASLAAQKIIDDEIAAQEAAEKVIEDERKVRYDRGKRDVMRYNPVQDSQSDMLRLGGQL